MKAPPNTILRIAIGLVAAVGLAGVLPVSLTEIASGAACPHLGPVPACHLVSLSYGAVLLSVLHGALWSSLLFLAGWLPIFLLAAGGSGLELLGLDVCPKTESGIPKCFFSLGLAMVLLLPFLVHVAKTRRADGAA